MREALVAVGRFLTLYVSLPMVVLILLAGWVARRRER